MNTQIKRLTYNVSYEVACALRDKGYDEETNWYYHDEEEYHGDDTKEMVGDTAWPVWNSILQYRIAAPLVAEVLDWLMSFGVVVYVFPNGKKWQYRVSVISKKENATLPEYYLSSGDFSLWESAMEEAILNALDHVDEKEVRKRNIDPKRGGWC